MSGEAWIVLLAAAAAALVVARRIRGGGRVSSNEVLRRIEAGASIVDVRNPDEFSGGAYPGAINIPLPSLAGRLGEIPRDRPVVLYCRSGARSGVAAQMLRAAGFGDVLNAGGLSDMPPRAG